MKTKVCGITQLTDANVAIKAGAWALGFNFYAGSLRFLDLAAAKTIINQLAVNVIKVGVFVDAQAQDILDVSDVLGLDFTQVYQDYAVSKSYKKRMILCLQPLTIKDLPTRAVMDQYAYILIDSPRQTNGLYGGTGCLAQWDIAQKLACDYPLILAGGLNVDNLAAAINVVKPFAVDVASGVEHAPGVKHHTLIEQFIRKGKINET